MISISHYIYIVLILLILNTHLSFFFFFFFNDTATTEIYTLSLHDALPISASASRSARRRPSKALISQRARGLRQERIRVRTSRSSICPTAATEAASGRATTTSSSA